MPAKIEVQMTMVDKLSKTVDKVKGKIQQISKSFGDFTKKLINLKNIAIAAAFTVIGRAVIGAAAKIEVFAKQLEIVSGSAADANKQLAKMREFARTSPLETEDVVQSYVRLRAVGITPTMKEMRTLGGVAVLMNRQMTDVLSAFIGLHTRTLRRLGIQINRMGKMAVIESGNMRMTVENDARAIRVALLDLWEKRFPNAIEEAANTTVAKAAIMRSEIFELAAVVGKGLLPAWNAVVIATGKAAGEIRNLISPTAQRRIENFHKELKDLQTTMEVGFVQKGGGMFGPLTIVTAEKQAAAEQRVLDVRKKLLKIAVEKQFERKNEELLKRNEEAAKLEQDRVEAAAKAAEKAAEKRAKELKRLDKIRIKDNIKIAAWLDDQVTMTSKQESELLLLQGSMASNRIEITREEWEEKNRIQAEAMNIRKTQLQIELEEEIAILKQKKILYPQLVEEIGVLINQKQKDLAEERKRITAEENQEIIDGSMRLGSALNNMATTVANIKIQNLQREVAEGKKSVEAARKEAKRIQNILIALAVAEQAASAVTAAKAGWDTGGKVNVYLGAALAAAAVIEAIAITASQIASIKSQTFARGTSFAPGGMSLVGEEGPEMINLPRGSQVMTNAQTRNNFGGTTFSPTIIIQGDASDRTVEKIGNTLEQFGMDFSNAIRKGHIDPQRLGFVTV